jgi:hypothetical protein
MRTRYILIGVVIGVLFASAAVTLAGNLNPSVGPAEAGSQMYTLEQIYDRLASGAAATKMDTFTEPTSGPGSTMHTLNEIMAKAPVTHTNGATPTHVLTGTTFWGLHSSAWGTQTGTMADNGAVTIAPTTTQQTIAAGYHDGSGYVVGDTDLVSGNIKSGVTIFEVTGERYGGCTCAGTLNGTRWCDNGNGTVTDLLGHNGKGQCLVWLQNASWGGLKPWEDCTDHDDAHTKASSCGEEYEDWRLPTLSELYGLTHGTEPVLCWPGPCDVYAFTGVQSDLYWSSTTYAVATDIAWGVYLIDGFVYYGDKALSYYVLPVRGGQ